jgi:hypothetical protein
VAAESSSKRMERPVAGLRVRLSRWARHLHTVLKLRMLLLSLHV